MRMKPDVIHFPAKPNSQQNKLGRLNKSLSWTMPKRSNPFGELSPLQMKTHVGKKEVDLGVAQEERMKSVYEKTRDLLFKGSQKAFTEGTVVLDDNDNMTWQTPSSSTGTSVRLPGQMCLDQKGQLTTEGPTEETEIRMTTDEDMAVGIGGGCDATDRLPGQLCLDASGQLVTSTGVSEDKSEKQNSESTGFSFKKDSTFPSLKPKPKDACISCRKCIPRGSVPPCNFCEQVKCTKCSRQCSQCGGDFCHLCSIINYDEAMERSFCLNCS